MKIVFNKSIDKIDRTDFWIRYIILLIVDFVVNFVLAMIQLSLHTDFTSISGIIIIMIIYNLLAFICFYELGKKRFNDAGLPTLLLIISIVLSFFAIGIGIQLYGFCAKSKQDIRRISN